MIASVERAKFHSGTSSSWLLEQMSHGPEYLDAVITNESDVIEFNRSQASKLREPIVAIYPQDGTILSGHPFAILDGAPWVNGEQVEAAKLFRDFLLTAEQQEAVVGLGLRPANPAVKIGSPIVTGNGVNPKAKLVTLSLPDVLVMDRITEVWHKIKKHGIIAIVFDKSGSMWGSKINAALAGTKEFVTRMDGEDWLTWIPFDDKVYMSTIGLKSQVGETLIRDINSTSSGGNTALYDAIFQAYELLEDQRKIYGDSVRYGLVILSDGGDTSSKQTLAMLEQKLKPAESDASGIQIHAVAIGNDANEGVLKKIANSGHGKFWKGQTPAEMVKIYQDIATYY